MITHKGGSGQRQWRFGTTEPEITNWGLGVRNTQETVHPTCRSSLKRCIVQANHRTSVAFIRSSSSIDANTCEGG